ncbi:MAG TPA: HlyD family secretion protein [Caulobacteraceae bacterium]|nr:HlyD family secretion protein [Caulobacteraceae bacterium]
MAILPRRFVPLAVGGVMVLAVAAGAAWWWTERQRFESTDNAFVEADIVQVSPQVAANVAEVLVTDNQHVAPGQVLVQLDPSTIQARLDQAAANVESQAAAVKAVDDKARLEEAMIAQRQAGVASAEAQAEMARADMDRYRALAGQGWAAPQKMQSQKATLGQAAAAVDQARAALEAERRTAAALASSRAQTVAQTAAARAAAAQARIDLEHTVIRAPIEGVVGARAVRAGQLVQPGMTLMALVPLGRTYGVANFKETQVARLRIGQPVEIRADAFGKRAIAGRIESFAPATGSEFALIPVENAVGNFTKVTQRVPVKIAVTGGPLAAALRPGLSVEVKVDVSDQSGVSFADAAGAAGRQFARRGGEQ